VAAVPTIGVSLAVPEPWGSELQQFRISMGDEAARHIPTHITLLPPHEVDESELPAIEDHLAAVASQLRPFRVHLRGTGTFEPISPVVFVGVVQGISQCEMLAAAVVSGPLAIDRAFPFHPHVTIAHHLPEAALEKAFVELERFEATFEVGEMWMYLHDPASGWQPTNAFAFPRDSATSPTA
jgi:2'-5' RNA ligase